MVGLYRRFSRALRGSRASLSQLSTAHEPCPRNTPSPRHKVKLQYDGCASGAWVKTTAILIAFASLPFFSAININFDSAKPGELPPGWTSTFTTQGAPPRWVVLHDPNAPSRPNVLAQDSGQGALLRFPMCLFDRVTCLDGDVSVKLKILSGRDGQDAGVVFRAADSTHYYLVRASAREHNIVMFRVTDGRFEAIPVKGAPAGTVGVRHPIKVGDWNLLRVTYKGSQTTVYFDHRRVFDAFDSAPKTPGRAGVWTKADTVAYFDDFRIDKKR